MPKISVIVPVYNVEAYLSRCINSILAQSFTDFELILIDDGSPDRCGEICDEYAAEDSRIRVIHQENARLSAARNAGIDIASGDWIAFVDSDDWLHKDYLKILINGSLEDTDIVICDCLTTVNEIEDAEPSDIKYKNVSLEEIQMNHIMNSRVWGRIIRRSTIDDFRFVSGTEPTEDSYFNELFFESDMKFRMTDAKLYYYYQRPDSAIRTHFGRGSFSSVKTMLDQLKNIKNIEKRKRIILRCYKYILSARFGEMFTKDYDDVLKQCKGILEELSGCRSELDIKDRIVFSLLSRFPRIYRAWRIYDDPTLKEFERNKKEQLEQAED